MTFLFSRGGAATSSDSLLTSGSDEPDLEAQNIPQPEPLGSSKALSPAVHNKWWWRKKLPGTTAHSSSNGSRSPPRKAKQYAASPTMSALSASQSSAAFPSDGKLGLIVGLFVVLAVTTLITVQFRDSELILALFTAVALMALALIYYFHCCASSPSMVSRWFWYGRKSGKVEDVEPLTLPPPSSSSLEGSAVVADPSMTEVDKSTGALPAQLGTPANTAIIKASQHRRDWSLPTMPTGTLLSHRRVSNGSSSSNSPAPAVVAVGTTSFPSSSFDLPQQQPYQLVAKLRIEFSLDDPVQSRVAHVSNALKQLATETDSFWIYEARLADAITTALTSCMSRSTLSEVKQALDKELRAANLGDRYSSLYTAVYSFLQKGERDAVLTHLSAVHHQDRQPQDALLQTVKEQDDVVIIPPKRRLLISDIDDTLVPTFKDRRGFSWGIPYPGVRQLYKELVIMNSNKEEEDEPTLLRERVAFVTARPGLLRTWTRQEITKAGFGGSLILMGYATTATTPQGMLSQKVKQVRELKALWPECSIILVGDNGQRDIDLGAMLLKEDLVEAVFIHDIFASDEEIIRTTSTSFSGEDNALNKLGGEDEESDAFLSSPSFSRSPASIKHEESVDDEFSHLALNDDRRAAAVQAKPMVRLVSAPAALGTINKNHSGLVSPKNGKVEQKKQPAPQQQQRSVMVLEPSVPVGFRHEECSKAGIDLFQTYAGAALRCYQKGLISVEALERVTRACASDLGATSIEGMVKQRLVDGLLRDVARVALEFKDKSPSEKVEFLEFIHEAIRKRN